MSTGSSARTITFHGLTPRSVRRATGVSTRPPHPLRAGAPLLRVPAPLLRAGAPLLRSGAPLLRAPAPLPRAGAPLLRVPAPLLRAAVPPLHAPAPPLRAPDPPFHAPALLVRVPDPLLHAGGRPLRADGRLLRAGGPLPRVGGPLLRAAGGPPLRVGGPLLHAGGCPLRAGGPPLRADWPPLRVATLLQAAGTLLSVGDPPLRAAGPPAPSGDPRLRVSGAPPPVGDPPLRAAGAPPHVAGPPLLSGSRFGITGCPTRNRTPAAYFCGPHSHRDNHLVLPTRRSFHHAYFHMKEAGSQRLNQPISHPVSGTTGDRADRGSAPGWKTKSKTEPIRHSTPRAALIMSTLIAAGCGTPSAIFRSSPTSSGTPRSPLPRHRHPSANPNSGHNLEGASAPERAAGCRDADFTGSCASRYGGRDLGWRNDGEHGRYAVEADAGRAREIRSQYFDLVSHGGEMRQRFHECSEPHGEAIHNAIAIGPTVEGCSVEVPIGPLH